MSELQKLAITGLSLSVLAVGGGVVCLGLWLLLPVGSRRLLPLARRRSVPWTWPDVLAAFLITYLVPSLVYQPLNQLGFFTLLYGEEGSLPSQRERAALFVQALTVPVQVMLVLTGLAVLRGAWPARVGLGRGRFAQNVVAGYLTWLVVTPPALLLNALLGLLVKSQEHLFERISQLRLFEWEWGVIVFLAVVGAPLLEELLFRGVLLSWQLCSNLVAQLVVGVIALVVAAAFGIGKGPTFDPGPALFILAMLPGYAVILHMHRGPKSGAITPTADRTAEPAAMGQYTPRPPDLAPDRPRSEPRVSAVLALYSNALLFAAFHSSVWPTPIPLFFLGFVLAWLAYRTRSLVGPIVTHALFNGVATLYLFLT